MVEIPFKTAQEFLATFHDVVKDTVIDKTYMSVEDAMTVLDSYEHYNPLYQAAFIRFPIQMMIEVSKRPLYDTKVFPSHKRTAERRKLLKRNGWRWHQPQHEKIIYYSKHLCGPVTKPMTKEEQEERYYDSVKTGLLNHLILSSSEYNKLVPGANIKPGHFVSRWMHRPIRSGTNNTTHNLLKGL